MNPFELALNILKTENLDHYYNIMEASPGHDLDRYPDSPALVEAKHQMSQAPQSLGDAPPAPSTSHDDITAHLMEMANQGVIDLVTANHIFERLTGIGDPMPEVGREQQSTSMQQSPAPPPQEGWGEHTLINRGRGF